MDNTVAPESSDESTFADYAEGASRLFDMLCDVEAEFFNKAGNSASSKTFFGNGIDMLALPPFVGNISAVTIDDEAFDADDWRYKNGYLINKSGNFETDAEIVVTARWGFSEILAEVKLVVNELGVYLWRNRDPLFAKLSDVEIETELSPTTNAIIKKFREKYSQSYL